MNQAGQRGKSGESGEQSGSAGQNPKQAENASQDSKPGGGKSSQPGHSGSSGSEEQKRQFAAQLLGDLREDAMDSLSAGSSSGDHRKLRNILSRTSGGGLDWDTLPGLFEEIDPPLQGVIQLLRVELANARRPHQLIVTELEQSALCDKRIS